MPTACWVAVIWGCAAAPPSLEFSAAVRYLVNLDQAEKHTLKSYWG
jgi:hypothetical protein